MSKSPWKTDKWWVSPTNFFTEVREGMNFPDRVLIHDITLRDGEQQAGLVFRKEDKIRIARMLDEMGVQRIEAGMPAVSAEDREAIKTISHEVNAQVFCLTRCMVRDIDLALNCDVDGIVLEIPSSEHMIERAYKWPIEKAIDLSVKATNYAAEHGLYVAFFTVDGTRADIEWWFRVLEEVATNGHMDSLAIVDTMGGCTPEAIAYYVRRAKEKFKKPIEVHCHNDFGLAVANTLAGISAGAEVAHTTVNAVGERVGGASLEEFVMALRLLYGIDVGLKLERLYELSTLVQELTGVPMPPHKPIVGDGIFKVESGLVVSWLLRSGVEDPLILYPFHWDLVGQNPLEIITGKMSGVDSILYKAEEFGFSVSKDQINEILEEVKKESLRLKGPLSDDNLKGILKRKLGR